MEVQTGKRMKHPMKPPLFEVRFNPPKQARLAPGETERENEGLPFSHAFTGQSFVHCVQLPGQCSHSLRVSPGRRTKGPVSERQHHL